jgi:signal transduction histidine kinase
MVYLCLLLIMMFLRCCNTCQRDRVLVDIEKVIPFLKSRRLITILMVLKTIPSIVMGVMLGLLSRNVFFNTKKTLFHIVISQIALYTTFNIFNIVRLEQEDRSYLVLNARFTDFISIFLVDIILIAVLMFTLLVLRQAELYTLVQLGVYKNVEELTDKEIITEYEKLKKQSLKL